MMIKKFESNETQIRVMDRSSELECLNTLERAIAEMSDKDVENYLVALCQEVSAPPVNDVTFGSVVWPLTLAEPCGSTFWAERLGKVSVCWTSCDNYPTATWTNVEGCVDEDTGQISGMIGALKEQEKIRAKRGLGRFHG